MPSCERATMASRLEALCGREGASEDYVRFRVELLEAQTAVFEALDRSASPPGASRPAGAKEDGKGAALGPDDVPFDEGLLARLARDVAAALRRRGRDSKDIARLLTAAAGEPGFLETLARKAGFGPDEAALAGLGEHSGLSPEALLFLGRLLAAPFVADAVRRLKRRGGVPAAEPRGRCPYCGSWPGLAKLRREEGGRTLFCSLCGESWEFARTACPFCGDGRALGTLSVGTAEARWIETCERCRGYLKTVDERKLPEGETVVPLIEATATLYLDLIAEQEGYAAPPPYAALR